MKYMVHQLIGYYKYIRQYEALFIAQHKTFYIFNDILLVAHVVYHNVLIGFFFNERFRYYLWRGLR